MVSNSAVELIALTTPIVYVKLRGEWVGRGGFVGAGGAEQAGGVDFI